MARGYDTLIHRETEEFQSNYWSGWVERFRGVRKIKRFWTNKGPVSPSMYKIEITRNTKPKRRKRMLVGGKGR